MYYTEKSIIDILKDANLSGFTEPLKGECRRYVVGLTDNTVRSAELLICQIELYRNMYDSITIGGWTKKTTSVGNVVKVDIGTSTDDLDEALMLGAIYGQDCIRDRHTNEDIPVK